MAYRLSSPVEACSIICGCPLVPLNSQDKGNSVDVTDPVGEAIRFFRANVLFRSFEVRTPSDRLLVYLTLYISLCLRKLAAERVAERDADFVLHALAHGPFLLPGDPQFPLNDLLTSPEDEEQKETLRGYLTRCREAIGRSLVRLCYRDGEPNKFWLAYGSRRFMNKAL